MMFVRARSTSYERWPGEKLAVQVARLRVHEERRERLGVAPEQRVGERHVAPVEAHEVQAHEQHGERVDEARRGVRAQRLAEQRAVRERELQVLRDEDGLEPLAVRVLAPRDDSHRHDARHLEPPELAQQLVLAVRDRLADLLDGDDAPREADEPHDVPGDTARQRREGLGRPLLERDVPGQVEESRVGGRRGDLQVVHRHGVHCPRSASRARRGCVVGPPHDGGARRPRVEAGGRRVGARAAPGAGARATHPGSRQEQSSASCSTSTVEVTSSPSTVAVPVTVTVPLATEAERTANDWYAFLPGATSANSRVP